MPRGPFDILRAPGRRGWLGMIAPGLLLLLLGVQLVQGFRGFDVHHGGLLGLLEAPGRLLGWGGVIVLGVLASWLLLGWWGRPLLGLEAWSGVGLRLLGCLALAVALAGLAALINGSAAGGAVGEALASLLRDSVGSLLGGVMLLAMAIPSGLLAASPFFLAREEGSRVEVRVPKRVDELEPRPGLFQGAQDPDPVAPYPTRRYDEEGQEIPITFGDRDVGPVRYADDPASAAARLPPEPPPPVDVGDDLPAGVRFVDDPEDEPEVPEEADSRERRLAPGVRYADADEDEDDGGDDAAEEEGPVVEAPPEGDATDDEGADEESDGSVDAPEDSGSRDVAAVMTAKRPPRAEPPPAPPGREESVERAMEALRSPEDGESYRSKLAGSGIFDGPDVDAPAEAAPPPKAKARKKAKGKKAAGKRKAKPKAPRKTKAKAKPKGKTKPKAKAKGKAKAKATATATAKRTKTKKEPPPASPAPAADPAPEGSLVDRAANEALERGAASAVMLSRRLGIGYARARALMEELVEAGLLGEMTASGSRPVQMDRDDWEGRS